MGIHINIGGSRRGGGFGRRRYRRSRPATPLGTMIGGVIVVLFGGGFYFADQSSAAATAEILEQGNRAEATVTNTREVQRERTDSDGRRRSGGSDYYVSLEFTDENGQTHTLNDRSVSSRVYRGAQGNTIRVAYMPDNPTGRMAFPEHESGEANPWIGFVIGLIGLLLAGFGFYQFRRQRSQASDGDGAEGSEEGEDGDGGHEYRKQDESQDV